jgi:hypothetical protein
MSLLLAHDGRSEPAVNNGNYLAADVSQVSATPLRRRAASSIRIKLRQLS